jgi:hypothetical protein
MVGREERAVQAQAEELIAEAEAALRGRLVEAACGHERPGAAWVCLNTLAHADWGTLSEVADGSRRGHGDVWAAALMFLAGEALSASGSADALVEVQRGGLIPLELDVLGGVVQLPAAPARLVSLVRAQLARATSRRPRA